MVMLGQSTVLFMRHPSIEAAMATEEATAATDTVAAGNLNILVELLELMKHLHRWNLVSTVFSCACQAPARRGEEPGQLASD